MNVRIGYATHPGLVRPHNEDNYGILLSPQAAPEITALLVAADGMGGHQAGEVASGFLVQNVLRLFESTANYRAVAGYSPDRDDYFAAVLKDVLETMNDQLQGKAASHEGLRGMGTTATVALLSQQRLFIGHVGDSRAYLVRNGQLQQLTHDDHSEGEASNVLTQAIGAGFTVRVDRSIHAVQAGDCLLLCTDGLTNVVSDQEILQAIVSQKEPQPACEQLIALANQRGGPDNITAILARIEANGAAPRSAAISSVPRPTNLGEQQDSQPVAWSAAPRSAAISSVPRPMNAVEQQDTQPVARPVAPRAAQSAALVRFAAPLASAQPSVQARPQRRGLGNWLLIALLALLALLSGALTMGGITVLGDTIYTVPAISGTVAVINFCVGAGLGAAILRRLRR
ncbi:MAG: PP2C family serine/threonine-protein phosphatase [Chloroflexota bacterium]